MGNKKKVMVGMSGGVDSSVTAAILLDIGYEVVGITMQVWPDNINRLSKTENGCCSLTAVDDARRIANNLGIAHYVMNFKEAFQDKVIEYFKDEYFQGRTPNPCIACNKYIKFSDLLNKAQAMDIDYIATGHYAKIDIDQEGLYTLARADDNNKDQTYVLYNMTQNQLARILMPLGSYEKPKVREMARELGFSVADKKDSQEICFIEDNNYAKFIEENTNRKIIPGNFVDKNGKIIGKHRGIIYYTIGQRKGLGVTFGKPMFVQKIDPDTNSIILGDNEDLLSDRLIAENINIISGKKITDSLELEAKIRYSAKLAKAKIYPLDDSSVEVIFSEPQRAITPGQAVVFYRDNFVIGGGTIK